jgi:hypothetical protein
MSESLTDEQLNQLEKAAHNTVGGDERSQMLVAGALRLVAEVRDLRLQVKQLAEALEVASGCIKDGGIYFEYGEEE